MKSPSTIFLLTSVIFFSGCTQQTGGNEPVQARPTEAQTRAANEASLLAVAKGAGVSEADALVAKIEIDKVYADTSAKMSQAEVERNARMKQLKNEACIDNCSGN